MHVMKVELITIYQYNYNKFMKEPTKEHKYNNDSNESKIQIQYKDLNHK